MAKEGQRLVSAWCLESHLQRHVRAHLGAEVLWKLLLSVVWLLGWGDPRLGLAGTGYGHAHRGLSMQLGFLLAWW